MKNILLIFVVTLMINTNALDFPRPGRLFRNAPPPPPEISGRSVAAITQEQFTQKLDHFDPISTVTFPQRFYVNNAYFNTVEKNVAFLMVGGEATASPSWMNYGPWIASAKKYKALLFQLEHRFYGNSQPFSELSLENLRYLSSQQALADLANFIVAMNKRFELSPDVKWILFGGSYAGSLAAWAREKYPHLVHGAMSASGPLLAKLDFYEYMQVVADDLQASSQECVDVVKTAINQTETLLKSGSRDVTRIFNLCDYIEDDLDNSWDVAYFFETITEGFAAVAQYNNIPGTKLNIDDLCSILTSTTEGAEINRLAAVHKLYHGSHCFNYKYDRVIDYLKNASNTDGDRQWYYQTCTEYGWYQTTNQNAHVFGNRYPVDYFTRLCTEAYTDRLSDNFITQQIDRTNMEYGALNIETTNIVFVHGTFDPWHSIGLTKTNNPESPVILINGTSHCANFYEQTANDLPALIAAREEVDRIIGVWLGK